MDENYVRDVWLNGEDPRSFFRVKPPQVVSDDPWEVVLVEVDGRMRLHVFRQLTPNAPVFLAGAFAPYELKHFIDVQGTTLLIAEDLDYNYLVVDGDNFTSTVVTGQFSELGDSRAVSVKFDLDFKLSNAEELRKYKLRLKRAAKKWLADHPDGVPPTDVRAKAVGRPDPLLVQRQKRQHA